MTEIFITPHAWEQMFERGISVNKIEEAISCGQRIFDEKRRRWHFRHRYYELVCDVEEDEITVITVYLVV